MAGGHDLIPAHIGRAPVLTRIARPALRASPLRALQACVGGRRWAAACYPCGWPSCWWQRCQRGPRRSSPVPSGPGRRSERCAAGPGACRAMSHPRLTAPAAWGCACATVRPASVSRGCRPAAAAAGGAPSGARRSPASSCRRPHCSSAPRTPPRLTRQSGAWRRRRMWRRWWCASSAARCDGGRCWPGPQRGTALHR